MHVIARLKPVKGAVVGVYVPDSRTILLGRVPDRYHLLNRETGNAESLFSLGGFLNLLQKGDEEARKILMAPDDAFLNPPCAEWRAIQNNADCLLGQSQTQLAQVCADRLQVTFYKSAILGEARETTCG